MDPALELHPERRVLRPARLEDAPVLAAAQREVARIPGALASRPEEIDDEAVRQKIASLAGHGAGTCVVIDRGGSLLGHAFLEPHRFAALSHVVFLTLVIHAGSQGRGLGRMLTEHLIAWYRANPRVEKFELQVRSAKARAVRLYQSLGFVEEGRKTRRVKYGPGDYRTTCTWPAGSADPPWLHRAAQARSDGKRRLPGF